MKNGGTEKLGNYFSKMEEQVEKKARSTGS